MRCPHFHPGLNCEPGGLLDEQLADAVWLSLDGS